MRTFLKLDFGAEGGDLYYPICNHGLSPLAGVQHSKDYVRQVEEDKRDLKDASAVTYGDQKSARSKPPPSPRNFCLVCTC